MEQIQTQTVDLNQTQVDLKTLAVKLLTGEALTPEEALSLTDGAVAREVYYLLWHYTFWGW